MWTIDFRHALFASLIAGCLAASLANAHSLPAGLKEKDLQEMRLEPKSVAPFQLQDQHGKPFTQTSFQGRWHLLMFGFTSCPDICPVHMSHLAGMRKQMLEQGYEQSALPVVALVTVDPKRDTAEALGAYVRNFHESFLGITGSSEEIAKLEKSLASAHRIFSEDVDGNYDVMHTSSVYAINPQGQVVAKIQPPFNPA